MRRVGRVPSGVNWLRSKAASNPPALTANRRLFWVNRHGAARNAVVADIGLRLRIDHVAVGVIKQSSGENDVRVVVTKRSRLVSCCSDAIPFASMVIRVKKLDEPSPYSIDGLAPKTTVDMNDLLSFGLFTSPSQIDA